MATDRNRLAKVRISVLRKRGITRAATGICVAIEVPKIARQVRTARLSIAPAAAGRVRACRNSCLGGLGRLRAEQHGRGIAGREMDQEEDHDGNAEHHRQHAQNRRLSERRATEPAPLLDRDGREIEPVFRRIDETFDLRRQQNRLHVVETAQTPHRP